MWKYFRKSEGRWYIKWREKGSRKIHSKRRAVFVWEKEHGKLPEGYEIHHINFDKTDDRIENLQCMRRREHKLLHGREREDHKVINGIEYRKCQRCEEYKILTEFQRRSAGTYQGYCKECQRKVLQEWRESNRKHYNEYMRKYNKKYRAK